MAKPEGRIACRPRYVDQWSMATALLQQNKPIENGSSYIRKPHKLPLKTDELLEPRRLTQTPLVAKDT